MTHMAEGFWYSPYNFAIVSATIAFSNEGNLLIFNWYKIYYNILNMDHNKIMPKKSKSMQRAFIKKRNDPLRNFVNFERGPKCREAHKKKLQGI